MVRGTTMQLDGTKTDIKLVELVVNEMMITINNKGFIEPEEIRTYMESLANGDPVSMNGNGDEPVVLYTHKGSVRARTGGQKKYLDAYPRALYDIWSEWKGMSNIIELGKTQSLRNNERK